MPGDLNALIGGFLLSDIEPSAYRVRIGNIF
jgi:hypothetical protein